MALIEQFPAEDRQRIRDVLAIIASGQELDLSRFADATLERIAALNTDEELDDYTYRVAGCVGEFWTKMCRAHLIRDALLDEDWLTAQGVRFGKGLQLVNILRDLPRDLRHGRCYLPGDRLWAIGLAPSDLLDPTNGAKLRPLYDFYLAQAEDHLAAGWQYTNALPRSQARVDRHQNPGKIARCQRPRPRTTRQNQPGRAAPDRGPHRSPLPLVVGVASAVSSQAPPEFCLTMPSALVFSTFWGSCKQINSRKADYANAEVVPVSGRPP